MALRARKLSGAFEKQAPDLVNLLNVKRELFRLLCDLDGSEAGDDLVLIQTLQRLVCK